MDSIFQQADEAFKGVERRPTAQKGGAPAPPKSHDTSTPQDHAIGLFRTIHGYNCAFL